MRILLEAHHPAHIHFWKYPVQEMVARGHRVLMIARDRDVMKRLLGAYDWIDAVIPRRRDRDNRFPIVEMLQRQIRICTAIHTFQPDVVASLMGSYAQSAGVIGIRNIIFTDTETQAFNHLISHPFCDEIHTPDCFLTDLGPKHRRYHGLHELVYLHPARFIPDPKVLARYQGLAPGNFILVRMSAWNTFHDRNRHGIGSSIHSFVERYKERYRIVLSAEENKVVPGLEGFVLQIEPADFHDLLGHARLVLTEGASTASEAACLGVPSVFINSVGELGNFKLLDHRFGLLRAFRRADEGLPAAVAWLESLRSGPDPGYRARHGQFLREYGDVCSYVVRVLEA